MAMDDSEVDMDIVYIVRFMHIQYMNFCLSGVVDHVTPDLICQCGCQCGFTCSHE